MIANAVVDTSIDRDILEEIALAHKLSIEKIIDASKQIKEAQMFTIKDPIG